MSRRLPEFLRPAESDALIAAADSQRDRLIVLCGLGLGLRVAELTKLRIEDVDLAEKSVFVRLGKGKKDRYVPIPVDLVQPFANWIGQRSSGWVFPTPRRPEKPLTTRAVQLLMKRLRSKAGILRRVSPHVLRHSYASSLLRSGADVAEVSRLLGHSSLQVTSRYLHCDPARLKPVVDKLRLGRKEESDQVLPAPAPADPKNGCVGGVESAPDLANPDA